MIITGSSGSDGGSTGSGELVIVQMDPLAVDTVAGVDDFFDNFALTGAAAGYGGVAVPSWITIEESYTNRIQLAPGTYILTTSIAVSAPLYEFAGETLTMRATGTGGGGSQPYYVQSALPYSWDIEGLDPTYFIHSKIVSVPTNEAKQKLKFSGTLSAPVTEYPEGTALYGEAVIVRL